CAPTGSGKTMVARFAVELALTHATTCVYTAPIKALSNQKYREMAGVYGEDQVGLMTGDITINRGAPIIVMTTEVLRNLIFARDPFAASLGYVVLDEVHYLADESRGPVWEEILLELPEQTRVVSLSATVANAEEFHAWLESIRGTTRLVETSERPVPLIQHLARGKRIIPLFDGAAESEITTKRELTQQAESILAGRLPERVGPRQRAQILDQMGERDMLPAIHFIYSRKGCEMAVRDLDREHVILTTREERAAIHRALDPLREELTDDDARALHFRSFERALSRGYAAHHAGVYPALKEIIERLMQEGHLKLVYATGTLALGINMPVRTTVVESLRRFNGTDFTDLTRIEYTQLIGRAGRRGRDSVGHAIVLACEETASIGHTATGELEPLVSAFFPSYNTALNVLTTYDYASARALLARSFAQYQANRDLAELEIKRDKIRREILAQEERLEEACDRGSLPEYLRVRLASGRAASRARKKARAAYRQKVADSFFEPRG
ncbi:MAG: DEAD/DEAH box helicase, partial [Flaviflexus sp.]|nr:DEAD/DEAH box helicase [Flaviflexus sp.]